MPVFREHSAAAARRRAICRVRWGILPAGFPAVGRNPPALGGGGDLLA